LTSFGIISSNRTSWEFGTPFYGMGVLRQIDSEQANFRVTRHS
jgi:hypothetical protein